MLLGLSKILDVSLGFLVLNLNFVLEFFHVFGDLSLRFSFLVLNFSISLFKFLNLGTHLFVVMLVRKVFAIDVLDLSTKFSDLILVHLDVIFNKLDQLLHIDLLSLSHFSFQVLVLLLDQVVLFEDFG